MTKISLPDLHNQLSADSKAIILDCRSPEEFDDAFISGSIHIGNQIARYVRLLKLTPDQDIILLAKSEHARLIELFNKLGFENVKLAAEFEDIQELSSLGLLDLIISIEADELAMDLPFDEKARIIDLRTEDEFEKSHILDAENIPLEEFSDVGTIAEIEEHENIYLYGNTNDISFVGSLIKRQGIHNFRKIQASFEEISKTPGIKTQELKNKTAKED